MIFQHTRNVGNDENLKVRVKTVMLRHMHAKICYFKIFNHSMQGQYFSSNAHSHLTIKTMTYFINYRNDPFNVHLPF